MTLGAAKSALPFPVTHSNPARGTSETLPQSPIKDYQLRFAFTSHLPFACRAIG